MSLFTVVPFIHEPKGKRASPQSLQSLSQPLADRWAGHAGPTGSDENHRPGVAGQGVFVIRQLRTLPSVWDHSLGPFQHLTLSCLDGLTATDLPVCVDDYKRMLPWGKKKIISILFYLLLG